jgi:hypothetical protein
MSIFTNKQKIPVKVFFIDNGLSIRVIDIEEAKVLIEKREKGEVAEVVNHINTFWKNLSWKDNTEAISNSQDPVYLNSEGQETQNVNIYKYREFRLKKCLIEWDLKDEKGNIIPISPEVIDGLDSDFANGLLNAFDKKRFVGAGSDAEKK